MRLTSHMIEKAQAWIPFSAEQAQALGQAYAMYAQSEQAQRLLCDEERVLIESGPEAKLIACEGACQAAYGGLWRMHAVLTLLTRLEWLAAQYQAHGIPMAVLTDTLSDLPIWMNTCKRVTGAWGLIEYGWLGHHFRFRLFRVGRLQYIHEVSRVPATVFRHVDGSVCALAEPNARFKRDGEADGTNGLFDPQAWTATRVEDHQTVTGYPILRKGIACPQPATLDQNEWTAVLRPGDAVLDMHIPENGKLDMAQVHDSVQAAPAFFARHLGVRGVRAIVCCSWLLDYALSDMLPGSNLARFQQCFHCVPFKSNDGQMFDRVYHRPLDTWRAMPMETTLQRAVRGWYEAGHRCRNAYGFILVPPVMAE